MRWQARWLNLAAGAVMGLAIAAPHYVAMAALRFIDAPGELELATTVEGTSLALAVAAVALVIGGLVIAINVGLRYRQMFLQMQQSESRLRAIADTAVDGMVMIDAQGRVQSFNAAAERILGWRPEDVVGQNVSILMPEPDRSRHDTYIQRYLQGQGGGLIGGNGREVLALRPDGSTVPIRISIGRVPLDGDPVFVGFINDLTQRRAMEQELQASEQRLRSLMADIPGRHLPLPLRRRLDHAVHQRCGDRHSRAGCRRTFWKAVSTSPSSRCLKRWTAFGRKCPRPSRSTDLTSWSLACGTATGDCAGCRRAAAPWRATTARCCGLTASSWT